jgi:hypothetical protein
MDKMSLWVSSWRGDVTRCKKLYESVQKFNEDKLPFYVVMSKDDIEFFKNEMGSDGITYVDEAQINPYKGKYDGWRIQMVNKMHFWKLGLTKNYFVMDSDCLFIKPFYEDDFIAYDDIPYTTVFEDNVYQLTIRPENYEGWKDHHGREYIDLCYKDWQRGVRKVIPNTYKKHLHFGPCPVTYNTSVWKSFYEDYVEANGLQTHDIIAHVSADYSWYGEYLMYAKVIDIVPTEAQFLVMHNRKQYEWFKKNITLDEIKRVYLGVIINSSFYAGEENEELLMRASAGSMQNPWQLSKSLTPKHFGGWYEEALK